MMGNGCQGYEREIDLACAPWSRLIHSWDVSKSVKLCVDSMAQAVYL